jgi:hypothetical protein
MDNSKAKAGGPRESMPAVYPCKSRSDTGSEGEEESPSSKKEARYEGFGLGKPPGGAFSGKKWLVRRSRSSIFLSPNDTSTETPTKLRGASRYFVFRVVYANLCPIRLESSVAYTYTSLASQVYFHV